MDVTEGDDGLAGTLPPSLTPFLGFLLRRAYARSMECLASTLPGDRHPSEMAVLAAVEAFGPASQRVLGERLAINRTVMVQIIDRLEADGLVARNRDPRDRRSYAVELTDRGRRGVATLDAQVSAHTDCLTERLTMPERRRLNELLHALLSTPEGGLAGIPTKLRGWTGFLLARAHFVLRGLGKEPLAPLGIEPPHLASLILLDEMGPSSQQRLAGALGVSGTIVVQFVDRLEDEGLVERRRAPDDRRVHLLTVTPEGVKALDAGRRLVAQATDEFTETIGPEGAQDLRRLLTRLLGADERPS